MSEEVAERAPSTPAGGRSGAFAGERGSINTPPTPLPASRQWWEPLSRSERPWPSRQAFEGGRIRLMGAFKRFSFSMALTVKPEKRKKVVKQTNKTSAIAWPGVLVGYDDYSGASFFQVCLFFPTA